MRDKTYVFILLLFLFSCSEESVPEGLYDYQVERLLSGSNEKAWIQAKTIEQCSDSVFLKIELIENSIDSLDIFLISLNASCDRDTTYLGRAKPSSFSSGFIFTDSLLFSPNDFWVVEDITSKTLSLSREGIREDYLATSPKN